MAKSCRGLLGVRKRTKGLGVESALVVSAPLRLGSDACRCSVVAESGSPPPRRCLGRPDLWQHALLAVGCAGGGLLGFAEAQVGRSNGHTGLGSAGLQLHSPWWAQSVLRMLVVPWGRGCAWGTAPQYHSATNTGAVARVLTEELAR